jgi:hypothetical protein
MSDSISSVGAGRQAGVVAAIREAAAASGVDFGYLLRTAQRESSLDPSARARTSSATGLFQFTERTWLQTLERYGARHGVDASTMSREQALALRGDPGLSARMAGELTRENASILEGKLGRPPTQGELYMAHFMGPSEAGRLALAARDGAQGPASEMFPAAAAANASVFHDAQGNALDAAGLYRRLTSAAIGDADSGRVAAASVGASFETDGQALLAARTGLAQMSSALLAALFEVQGEDDGPRMWPRG